MDLKNYSFKENTVEKNIISKINAKMCDACQIEGVTPNPEDSISRYLCDRCNEYLVLCDSHARNDCVSCLQQKEVASKNHMNSVEYQISAIMYPNEERNRCDICGKTISRLYNKKLVQCQACHGHIMICSDHDSHEILKKCPCCLQIRNISNENCAADFIAFFTQPVGGPRLTLEQIKEALPVAASVQHGVDEAIEEHIEEQSIRDLIEDDVRQGSPVLNSLKCVRQEAINKRQEFKSKNPIEVMNTSDETPQTALARFMEMSSRRKK